MILDVRNAQTLAERKEEAAWAAAAASLSSSSSLEIHKVIFSRTCVIAVVTSNWYSLRLCGHSNGLLHLLPALFSVAQVNSAFYQQHDNLT